MTPARIRLKPYTTYEGSTYTGFVALIPATSAWCAAFVLTFVACGFSQARFAPQPDLDPRIVKLVSAVSEERLAATMKKLESFGTRNTLSSADSPTRGIGAARQ